jgi:hypothetical protein
VSRHFGKCRPKVVRVLLAASSASVGKAIRGKPNQGESSQAQKEKDAN